MDLPKYVIILLLLGVMLMPYERIYTSEETLKSLKEDRGIAIDYWSLRSNIDPNLIRSIVKKESENKSRALRIDYKVLKNQQWYINTLSKEERKQKKCYASYGLMQVLYGCAKHDGYKGIPEGLYSVDNSLKYGCKVLRANLVRYDGDVKKALAGYNGGHAAVLKKQKTGRYPRRVELYVKEVYDYYINTSQSNFKN